MMVDTLKKNIQILNLATYCYYALRKIELYRRLQHRQYVQIHAQLGHEGPPLCEEALLLTPVVVQALRPVTDDSQ
jgi:hypothetical protein